MNLVNIVDPQNEKINSELCLGIDFGTTNSVCSIKKDNKIVFVEDFGKKLIPSIILFKKKFLLEIKYKKYKKCQI
jgi:molecular chaperone DnaK (HSP70)